MAHREKQQNVKIIAGIKLDLANVECRDAPVSPDSPRGTRLKPLMRGGPPSNADVELGIRGKNPIVKPSVAYSRQKRTYQKVETRMVNVETQPSPLSGISPFETVVEDEGLADYNPMLGYMMDKGGMKTAIGQQAMESPLQSPVENTAGTIKRNQITSDSEEPTLTRLTPQQVPRRHVKMITGTGPTI